MRAHMRYALALALLLSTSLVAQAPRAPVVLTTADYARAERFMTYNTTPLVLHSAGRATWLAGDNVDRVWYRTRTEQGEEAILVDAAQATRGKCTLPACEHLESEDSGRGAAQRRDVPSPDGKRTAFIRDWNLWIRDVASGKETALTTDGVKDFGYATDNAGWTKSDRAILVWSPDSKKIATFQQDQRNVGEMYLVDTKVGHPTLQAWKYPLPGDKVITMIQRVIVDVDSRRVTRLQMEPDQHRSTLCDDVSCSGEWADVQWGANSRLAFVSTSRDHTYEQLRVADTATGAV